LFGKRNPADRTSMSSNRSDVPSAKPARKGLQEIVDYPTGRFVEDRSHPMVDGNWTTTHLGEHKGHPSKTTVTSTTDRLPGEKSGKPGPVRTTYSIAIRYGPTTDTGKRYKFKTKPILVSHIRPHHLVGSEDLIMGDVHPTIRDTMLDHIRRHDTTLHPESPDVTELSPGRVLSTTMGGGSLSVGTVRDHEFSKRGPMDEGFLKSPGAAARKGLHEYSQYNTGEFIEDRSHPISNNIWTTRHLGAHEGHPSQTTVSSTTARAPTRPNGTLGSLVTTYMINRRHGPTTDKQSYAFEDPRVIVSHYGHSPVGGSQSLKFKGVADDDDVDPKIRDSAMSAIENHNSTLHPESQDVTPLSAGRLLPRERGGGSLTVGTAREYHSLSSMDEGFLKTAGHVALAGAMTLGGIGRINSTDNGHSIHHDTGTTTEVNSDNPFGPSKTTNLVRSGSDIKKTNRTSEIPGVTTKKENLPSTRTRTTGERFSMIQGGKTDRESSTNTSTQVGDQKPVVSSSSNRSFSIPKSAPKIGDIGVSTNVDMKGGGTVATKFKNLKQTEIAPTGKNISAIASPSFKLKRRGDSILKEEHDDLIKEISPVMWIHKDSIYGGGHEDGHDHNYLAQQILGDYGKRPEGNYSDQVLGLGGWTRLMKVGKNQFEIESASHDALRHSVRRIQPHIAGQKVRLEVRDPNNADPAHVWSRSNVDDEQLGDYIKYGHQARSLRSNSILKEVTTGTGRPIDIEQGKRLGNLKDSLKRKLEMQRSSGIEDNATYKDAPHAFRRQDSTRDKLARILQLMSAKGGNKKATKASNDNRTNRNDYRNQHKK